MSRLRLVGALVAHPEDLIAAEFAGRASVLVVSTSVASASATMARLRSRGWTTVHWDPEMAQPRRSAYDVVWVGDGDGERLLALTADEPAFAPILAAVRSGETRYVGVGAGASIAAAQVHVASARLGRLDRRTGLGLIAQWMSPDDAFTDWGEVRVTLGAHDAIMVEHGVPRIITPVPASHETTARVSAGGWEHPVALRRCGAAYAPDPRGGSGILATVPGPGRSRLVLVARRARTPDRLLVDHGVPVPGGRRCAGHRARGRRSFRRVGDAVLRRSDAPRRRLPGQPVAGGDAASPPPWLVPACGRVRARERPVVSRG